ncbi:MAG: DNA polymerase I, partial [Muribaculaceae bacterium]|nr:DNA polymerase I [Muribaculaceae bacterium]
KTFAARLNSRQSATDNTPPPSQPADDGMKSLFDLDSPAQETPTADTGDYTTAATIADAIAAIEAATRQPAAGIYIHAIGADAMTAAWKGIALSTAHGEAVYIPLPESQPERNTIRQAIADLLSSADTVIVSHDVKRDYIILKREGIDLSAQYYDTSVAHYLLQPEMRHDMTSVAATYLNHRTIAYEQTPSRTRKNGDDATASSPAQCCETADLSLRLFHELRPRLADNGLTPLMDQVELPLIRVLAEMEWTGVRINQPELAAMSQQLTARLSAMEREAYAMAGGEFNLASPMQVGEVLFGRLQIDPKAKRTKRGFYSTTEEILEKHRHTVPLVDLILKIRALRKLLTTYINALPEMINPATGKIHTSYNQTVTATGRISST